MAEDAPAVIRRQWLSRDVQDSIRRSAMYRVIMEDVGGADTGPGGLTKTTVQNIVDKAIGDALGGSY